MNLLAKTKGKTSAPGAPRVKVEPPKTPWHRTRAAKIVGVLVLVVLALVILMIVLGRNHRSSVLDRYDRDLGRAQRPFLQHQATTVPDSFINIPTRFRDGSVTAKQLDESASLWREDFADAADQVRVLEPPAQLAEAQVMIVQSLDQFSVIAELYLSLADLQRAANRARGAEAERLGGQVEDLLTRIDLARTVAQDLHDEGMSRIADLKRAWGLLDTAPPSTDELDLGDFDPSQLQDPDDFAPPSGFPLPDGGTHDGS